MAWLLISALISFSRESSLEMKDAFVVFPNICFWYCRWIQIKRKKAAGHCLNSNSFSSSIIKYWCFLTIIYGQFTLKRYQWGSESQNSTYDSVCIIRILLYFTTEFMPTVYLLDSHPRWFKTVYLKTLAQALKHLNVIKINFTYVIPSWIPLQIYISFKRN